MLASPAMLFYDPAFGIAVPKVGETAGILDVIFLSGWMCSVIGLRQLRATGDAPSGRIVLLMQIVGLLLAMIWSASHLVAPNINQNSALYRVGDAMWPLSVLFMIVVGLFTLRTARLDGWRRFTPLLCGLALPLMLMLGAILGREAMRWIGGLGFLIPWMLLGYAVRSSIATSAIPEYPHAH
jgi:hypothetical protein